MYTLGKIYSEPKTGFYDIDTAIEWFEKAASKGEPYSKLKLGLIYYRGEAVPKDIPKALSYLDEASAEGVSFAGDIAQSIRDRGKRNVHSHQKLIDNKELRMALYYLRQTLKVSTEHYLNMRRYEELQRELKESEIEEEQ